MAAKRLENIIMAGGLTIETMITPLVFIALAVLGGYLAYKLFKGRLEKSVSEGNNANMEDNAINAIRTTQYIIQSLERRGADCAEPKAWLERAEFALDRKNYNEARSFIDEAKAKLEIIKARLDRGIYTAEKTESIVTSEMEFGDETTRQTARKEPDAIVETRPATIPGKHHTSKRENYHSPADVTKETVDDTACESAASRIEESKGGVRVAEERSKKEIMDELKVSEEQFLKDKEKDRMPAKFTISMAMEAIERGRKAGEDISKAEEMLESAEKHMSAGDYPHALSCAARAKKLAEGPTLEEWVNGNGEKKQGDTPCDADCDDDASREERCSVCDQLKPPFIEMEVDNGVEYTCQECFNAQVSGANAATAPVSAQAEENVSSASKEEDAGKIPVKDAKTFDECKHCAKPLEPGDMFCGGCGKSIIEERFCPQCGNKTKDSDRFCRKCGARVE